MRFQLVVAALCSLPVQVVAQEAASDLLEPMVELQDGKMVIEFYTLDRISLPGYDPMQFQVKHYAEAPAEGIVSRDNFVAITTALNLMLLQQSFASALNVPASAFLDAYDIQDLDALIGTPDLELTLVLAAGGLQIEIKNTRTGEVSRTTQTWAEFRGEEDASP